MKFNFPLDYLGVTGEIERVRSDAGRDVAKLTALARELEEYLREAAPDEPELSRYAHVILDNYQVMARHGFFPEVFRDEEL